MSGKTTENDVVIMKNLSKVRSEPFCYLSFVLLILCTYTIKVYSTHLDGCSIQPPKAAVQGINLAISKGECFGLLGVNGRWLILLRKPEFTLLLHSVAFG